MSDLIVDVFCGGGGTSLGIEWATGRSPDIAINHDDAAIAMHMANHPETLHVREDVWKADLKRLTKGRRVGLLAASPDCVHFSRAKGSKPVSKNIRSLAWVLCQWGHEVRPELIIMENVSEFCFPAKTAVLTKRGLIPISQIEVGDEVWTHNARWKPVTAISTKQSKTVSLKGYGNSIAEATPDHRYYARQYAPLITKSGKFGRHESRLLEPEWVRADRMADVDRISSYTELHSGYAWASPRVLPKYWMRLPNASLGIDCTTPEFFYILGLWVGNGWIKKRSKRVDQDLVQLWATPSQADQFEAKLAGTGLKWSRSPHGDVFKFTLEVKSSRKFIPWLRRHFGEFSGGKTLPAWIYGASETQRWAFIEGYHDADGWASQASTEMSVGSTSRCLAVGVKLLLQSLEVSASISKSDETPDGRKNTFYLVTWRSEVQWEKCVRHDLHYWGPVREVIHNECELEVYDITVADDHSFVADGQVVHNCDWGPLVPRYACRACDWKGTEGQAKLARVNIRCPRCNAPRLKQIDEQFPDPARKGLTFKRWFGRLRNLGYQVDWKVLNAADYGAPTHRRRLFVIARRDGLPIVWPEPTHCNPKLLDSMPLFEPLKPWRTAAECIDWSIPCPSIFERKKPLKEATLRRIAMGLKRYVIDAEEPFLVPMTHSGERRCHPLSEPMPTITTAKRGEFAVCLPVIEKVSAFLAKHYGGMVGVDIRTPLPTTTSKGCQNQIVTANLVRFNFDDAGVDVNKPLPTITSNNHAALVYAYMVRYFGTAIGQSVSDPLTTLTTKARHALVIVTLAGEPYVIVDIGMRMLTPRELATAQGFPSDYILTGTKTSQVARIGNSVCPHVAKAIVEANYVNSGVMA